MWVIVLGICISIFVQFGQPVLGKYSTNVFIFIYIYIFLGFGSNFVFIVDLSWVLCVHFTLWYVLGTLCTIYPLIFPGYSVYNLPSDMSWLLCGYNWLPDMSWVLCVQFTLWYVMGTLCTIFLLICPGYSVYNLPSGMSWVFCV